MIEAIRENMRTIRDRLEDEEKFKEELRQKEKPEIIEYVIIWRRKAKKLEKQINMIKEIYEE